MNNVTLVGRLTKDPEVRYSTGEKATAIARFNLAVDRKFKDADGNYGADFINCQSFGKTAEFVEKYFHKGMKLGLVGRIQTGSYTNKDGVKVYTTDVVANEVEFVESKGNSENAASQKPSQTDNSFMDIPDGEDSELPFN